MSLTLYKIFCKTLAKLDKIMYLSNLFFYWFWLLPNLKYWRGDWPLSCVPTQFWDFLNILWFPKILSLKLFGNSWSNWYKFIILDIKSRFTCSELNLYCNTVNLTRITIWNELNFSKKYSMVVGSCRLEVFTGK